MENFEQKELSEIKKKLNEMERDLKNKDPYAQDVDGYGEIEEKIRGLEVKIDELTKRQASSHKVLTVLQQQISGLKVGINNLEDLLEQEDENIKGKRSRKGPMEPAPSKVGKIIGIVALLAVAFFIANRWITGFLESRWNEEPVGVPGIYESLDTPSDDRSQGRPYQEEIQTQIEEKLDKMAPVEETPSQTVVPDEVQTTQTENIPQTQELIEIFVPRVLILNGCGVPGIAAKLEDYLTRNGIRVVDSRNADNFNYPSTVIFSTSDNPDDHIWLDLIGVNAKTVKPLKEERDKANTVIILGKDYNKLPIY
ncbi:MAG: LytR C-terminal domain-containing protein [Candidatus Marinimicrobia bacterium]|nr:LytR C-terminal domain-containing protein [Candidatus Neomarinimicrobiota bacterium]